MDRAILTSVFVELGRRLRTFGEDEKSVSVIELAVAANEWFAPSEVVMAVRAICEEMLDEDKLQKWLANYNFPAKSMRVGIIMAGNIPLVGFFDLMCVLLCGYTAVIKPSSKDSVMMQYVIDILRDICPTIPIEKYSGDEQIDKVVATGGDAAAAHFRARYNNIPSLIRGSRHSVAVLSGEESNEQMNLLQRDIYTYSGLGCRNVSLIFAPRGWNGEIPNPESIVEMKRGNYLCDKAMMLMSKMEFLDLNGALAVESRSFPETLSRVHYTYYDSLAEVRAWLEENDGALQCVVSETIDHPRRADFGRAQYPTLWDYADGVDVMKFLID